VEGCGAVRGGGWPALAANAQDRGQARSMVISKNGIVAASLRWRHRLGCGFWRAAENAVDGGDCHQRDDGSG